MSFCSSVLIIQRSLIWYSVFNLLSFCPYYLKKHVLLSKLSMIINIPKLILNEQNLENVPISIAKKSMLITCRTKDKKFTQS